MKVAIITQPLLNNYGGLLQNYALQKVLSVLGCQPITIDYLRTIRPNIIKYIGGLVKNFILFILQKRKNIIWFSFTKALGIGIRKSWSNIFVSNIQRTNSFLSYKSSRNVLKECDCVIVGSDQVWRPKFVYCIYDYFGAFFRDLPIKRIVYAASFGVDNWEYSPIQTRECTALVRKFNAISVREESGVKLCKKHLGVDAAWVLDPTLLLKKEDYLQICENVPVCTEKYLAAYILDENEQVAETCKKEACSRGLVVKILRADSKSTLPVSEWLAIFRDASYVVTDSFHGMVFSIIWGKEFKCLYNQSRGSARFDSLLKLYESGKLEQMREFSLNWLKNALES